MKKPLLLLPGSLCDATLFQHQIAFFDADYDISVADLSRHNNITKIAQQVLADAPQTFALAGLSLGGIVALEIMTQAPQRVTRLALLDSNYRTMPADVAVVRQQEIDAIAEGGKTALMALIENHYYPRYVSTVHVADNVLKSIVLKMASVAGVPAMLNQWQAVIQRADYTQLLSEIACPTLVLCGEHDALCDLELHRTMAAQISKAILQVIPDCGHLSTLESPIAVNHALLEWLED